MIEIGSILNDTYLVTRTLGSGAFGSVFLASDTTIPGRQVAIKVLDMGASSNGYDDLIHEMHALTRLNHPVGRRGAPGQSYFLLLSGQEIQRCWCGVRKQVGGATSGSLLNFDFTVLKTRGSQDSKPASRSFCEVRNRRRKSVCHDEHTKPSGPEWIRSVAARSGMKGYSFSEANLQAGNQSCEETDENCRTQVNGR